MTRETKPKTATLADIARLSSTNVSTVSRILNDNKTFSASQECRQRVLKIARELKYRPKNSARSLATGKSYCIGVILCKVEDDFTSPYFAPVLINLIRKLEDHGYSTLLMPVSYGDSIDAQVREKIRSGGVDGFYIGSGMIGTQTLHELQQHRIPLVTTEHDNPHSLQEQPLCVISENCEEAYADMATQLRDLGHRRIACFGKGRTRDLQIRGDILQSALAEVGIEMRDEDRYFYTPTFMHNMHDRHEAHQAAEARMEWLRQYSAVVCPSDMTAFGLMDALEAAGIIPGRDISIAGYNNIEASPYFQPPEPFLTTIDPCKAEKGVLIARQLLKMIVEPERSVPDIAVEGKFILRRSLIPCRPEPE